MTFFKKNGSPMPEVFGGLAEATKAGKMDRREFLAMASVFGATAAAAYGMIGLTLPTPARAEGKKGGVLKMQMIIKEMKDWWIKHVEKAGFKLLETPRNFLFRGQMLVVERPA